VPVLSLVVGKCSNTRKLWRYYWDTIEACVPPEQILAALRKAGFTDVKRHIEVKGMSILAEYQATKAP
jgi:demethylmenaquinone methyltransferase / 2-methoxy-6-polyprenyl-1,4-benzoquinol methylase